jgi:hypothetical protein
VSLETNDTKTYDANQYRIAFLGVPLAKGAGASGFADGLFFEWEPNDKDFDAKLGTDGTVTRWCKNNTLFHGTLHLMQTSSTNAYLSTVNNIDRTTQGGQGIGSFVVQDLNGATVFTSVKAWIEGKPKGTLDREPSERAWPFAFTQVTYIEGGN